CHVLVPHSGGVKLVPCCERPDVMALVSGDRWSPTAPEVIDRDGPRSARSTWSGDGGRGIADGHTSPVPCRAPHSRNVRADMDITGASALVTGGASGIGAASARLLAQQGAKVVVADLQEEPGKALADEIG